MTEIKLRKQDKGITLIALVITIVVLLILAGISLNLVLGENGIIQKAKLSKDKSIIAEEEEKIEFIANEIQMNNILNPENEIDNEKLQEIVDMYFGTNNSGNSNATGVIDGDKYVITVIETGHVYIIDENGNIEKQSGYTVTYNLNGGSFSQNENVVRSYKTGELVTYPEPQKSGYAFGGWFETSGFTGEKVASNNLSDAKDIVLYANWLPVSSGDYFTYSVVDQENHTLMITGVTTAWNNACDDDVDDVVHLVIPTVYSGSLYPQYEGYSITKINNWVFGTNNGENSDSYRRAQKVEEIYIPETIVDINHCAFNGFKGVKSIVIKGEGLYNGSGVFNGCSNLEYIELPISTKMNFAMFDNTGEKLKTVKFTLGSGTWANFGSGAPWKRSLETSINILFDNGITTIAENTFSNTAALKQIALPSNIITIGNNAFKECGNLQTINFPESLESIGNAAFDSCTSLKNVKFPSSLTTIGWNGFRKCNSIEEVIIPVNIQSIGDNGFVDCIGLKKLTIAGNPTLGGGAFGGESALENLTISVSTDAIGTHISGCENSLKTVTFTPAVNNVICNYNRNIASAGTTLGYNTTPWFAARHNNLKIYVKEGVDFGSSSFIFFRSADESSKQERGGDGCNTTFYAYSNNITYYQNVGNYIDTIEFTII